MVLRCTKSTSTLFTAGKDYPVKQVVSEYDSPVNNVKYQVRTDLGSTAYCSLTGANVAFRLIINSKQEA